MYTVLYIYKKIGYKTRYKAITPEHCYPIIPIYNTTVPFCNLCFQQKIKNLNFILNILPIVR